MENYEKELENNLLEMVKQKEENDRMLLTLEVVIGVLSTIVLLAPVFVGALVPMENWKRIVVAFSGFVPGFVGFFFATKLEQVAGYYECQSCGHRYVPTYRAVNKAAHMGRTRRMKCPKCGARTWQKKRLSKK